MCLQYIKKEVETMYQEIIFVNSNDVDDHYDLKISTIFKYLQQVSTNHAELIGLGKKDTVDKGMFWVITRMKVVIHKMPKMLDTLKVTTHPGDTMLFVFPRFYQIYDQNDELCITASSSWVLLDINTHKVVMKPFSNDFSVPSETRPEDIPLPEKVNISTLYKVEDRKVRYSDIDLNGHLNNTKYIDYIIDTHDIDFYKTHRVKEIIVNYEKEIKDKDIVSIYSDNQDVETVVGDVDNIHCFTAKITYENRDK